MRNRVIVAGLLLAFVGVGCKKKEAGEQQAPKVASGKGTGTGTGTGTAAVVAKVASVPDDVDPMWIKELVEIPPPADPEPFAVIEEPDDLGFGADALAEELIGSCELTEGGESDWSFAQGKHLYATATCGLADYHVALVAFDGKRISAVGRKDYLADTATDVTFSEADGAVCIAGEAKLHHQPAPWRACFAVDDKVLADRATRGRTATAMAACPAAVAAMAACANDPELVKLGQVSGTSAKMIAAWAKDPETCSNWIELPLDPSDREYTVPITDWVALATAGKDSCAALAAAVAGQGGFPSSNPTADEAE